MQKEELIQRQPKCDKVKICQVGNTICIKNIGLDGPKERFTFPCRVSQKVFGFFILFYFFKGKEVSFCPLVALGKISRKGQKKERA